MSANRMSSQVAESHKGSISLLPNLLTTISLFSGFYAIISAIHAHYFNAAQALLVSAVFDGLDGRVARMTGTASHFGKEYDSLCDLVAFGVAPGVIVYLWALEAYGRFGWLACFLYVATTALRLARFNTQAGGSSRYFIGLPCPAAAVTLATTILFCGYFKVEPVHIGLVVLALVYTLSYLMVSSIKYRSFKHSEASRARKFQMMVAIVLLIMVVATEPRVTLFVMVVIYVLSGPCRALYRLFVPSGCSQALEGQDKPIYRD